MKHKEGGFTIVEVTIIVVVVGILASIVTISIANARTISRDNTWRLNAQASYTTNRVKILLHWE